MSENKSKIPIGIDLGTTNSAVAAFAGEGQYPVFINKEGSRTTESVVAFVEPSLVGKSAKRAGVNNPDAFFPLIKYLIGRTYDEASKSGIFEKLPFKVIKNADGSIGLNCIYKGNKKILSPVQVSAEILRYMAECAASQGYTCKDAVITVPAYFNDAQRQATSDAGKIAGLNVLRIINEPTAAALAYGCKNRGKDEKIVVFDLGGGTFDVTVLELSGDIFEVKSTGGDTTLGGADFDRAIFDYVIRKFKDENGIDLSLSDKGIVQTIRQACEDAKKTLSNSLEVDINIPFVCTGKNGSPLSLDVKVTRSTFENLIRNQIVKAIEITKKVVAESKIDKKEFNEILLVGGSTRIPLVKDLVTKFFEKEVSCQLNPDEAVAIGAAIQAGIISGVTEDAKGILLLDVTPLSLGLETLGGVFTVMIPKNTTIPTKKAQVFTTAEDNQPAVTIRVFQGERPMASDNHLLGNFELSVPPARRGVPQIEVTYDIDVNGITHVSAVDKSTGKSQKITISSSGSLTEERIRQMTEEAEANKEKDKQILELIEAKNHAEGLIYSAQNSLDENKNIPDEVKNTIGEKISSLREAIIQENTETIKQASNDLSNAMVELYNHIKPEGETPSQNV